MIEETVFIADDETDDAPRRCERCDRAAHDGECRPARPVVVFAEHGAKGHGGRAPIRTLN